MEFIVFVIFVLIAIAGAANKNKNQGKSNKTQNPAAELLREINGAGQPVQQRPVQQRPVQQRPVQQSSIQPKPVQQKPRNIVERAKINNDRLQKDQTLEELELSHNHKEAQPVKPVEHSAACQTHEQKTDVIIPSESQLGTIEDLMVKGFDGNMKFERDFVGEGLDMISTFTL